jgi:hypothetical protein
MASLNGGVLGLYFLRIREGLYGIKLTALQALSIFLAEIASYLVAWKYIRNYSFVILSVP